MGAARMWGACVPGVTKMFPPVPRIVQRFVQARARSPALAPVTLRVTPAPTRFGRRAIRTPLSLRDANGAIWRLAVLSKGATINAPSPTFSREMRLDTAEPSVRSFDRSLIRDGVRLIIRSACILCGESKLVSSADGSLDDWEDGHQCAAAAVQETPDSHAS